MCLGKFYDTTVLLSLLLTNPKVTLSLPILANSACAGTRPANSAPQKSAAPAPTVPTGANPAAVGGTCFKGAEFPSESAWLSLNTLVSQHTAAMGKFDSGAEIADVLSAIQSVAQMSGGILDPYVHQSPGRASSVVDDLSQLTLNLVQPCNIRSDDSGNAGQRAHCSR